jgi:hypothetical protein
LAYRILRVGWTGLWWWRKPTVKGALEISEWDDVSEEDGGLEDDDYVVRF